MPLFSVYFSLASGPLNYGTVDMNTAGKGSFGILLSFYLLNGWSEAETEPICLILSLVNHRVYRDSSAGRLNELARGSLGQPALMGRQDQHRLLWTGSCCVEVCRLNAIPP